MQCGSFRAYEDFVEPHTRVGALQLCRDTKDIVSGEVCEYDLARDGMGLPSEPAAETRSFPRLNAILLTAFPTVDARGLRLS